MAATGWGCEFGDCTSTPVYLHTNIPSGSTVSLCDEHNGPGLIPLLAASLGVGPGDLYAVIEKFIAREAKKAEKELAEAQAAAAAEGSQDLAPSPNGGPGDEHQGDEHDREETGLFHGTGEEAL